MENQRVIRQEIASTPEISKEALMAKGNSKAYVIRSNELSEIYNEWNATQKGDLFVNEELYRKLQEYIQYQKKLKPLKQELAEQLIEKYIVPEEFCEFTDGKMKSYEIYVNGEYVTFATVFFNNKGSSARNLILLRHFIYISSFLSDNRFSYIDIENQRNQYFDLRLWVYDMKGTIEVNEKEVQITIP